MKRILISIGSILVLAFVMVLFVSANPDNVDKKKKAKTELKQELGNNHCTGVCNPEKCGKTANCDPVKCKEKGCCHGVGTCDPSKCKGHEGMNCKEGKICDPAACPGHGGDKKK